MSKNVKRTINLKNKCKLSYGEERILLVECSQVSCVGGKRGRTHWHLQDVQTQHAYLRQARPKQKPAHSQKHNQLETNTYWSCPNFSFKLSLSLSLALTQSIPAAENLTQPKQEPVPPHSRHLRQASESPATVTTACTPRCTQQVGVGVMMQNMETNQNISSGLCCGRHCKTPISTINSIYAFKTWVYPSHIELLIPTSRRAHGSHLRFCLVAPNVEPVDLPIHADSLEANAKRGS